MRQGNLSTRCCVCLGAVSAGFRGVFGVEVRDAYSGPFRPPLSEGWKATLDNSTESLYSPEKPQEEKMAKERLSMRKIKEVLRLRFENHLSARQIANSRRGQA